jgi:phage/plasmid-associated DNA primase
VAGLERLRRRGRFQQPASAREAIQELEDLGSPVSAFTRERCTVAPGRSVPVQTLYDAWKAWCEAQGRDHSGTVQTFGRDLRAVVPGLKVTQPRSAGQARVYEGIALGQEPARHAVTRVSHHCTRSKTPLSLSQENNALKRVSARVSPAGNGANGNGWTCAYCQDPVEPGPGCTATSGGEYLHNQCVDPWSAS